MKKSGYDPKAIAHIEEDELDRRLKEKIGELQKGDISENSGSLDISIASKKKEPMGFDKPVTMEEIVEGFAQAVLEDIPLLPEKSGKAQTRKSKAPSKPKGMPRRSVVPYEVRVTENRFPDFNEKKSSLSESVPKETGGANSSLEGHRGRMRKRFFETGLRGFSAREALEVLMYFTVSRRDTASIARELTDKFGSLSGVLEAAPAELTAIPYITERTVRLFKLIPAVAEYREELVPGRIKPYEDYGRIMNEFVPKLRRGIENKLRIACFSADMKLTEISDIPLFEDNFTVETVRLTAKRILDCCCSGAVLVHSHEGGAAPTDEDISFTGKIGSVLSVLGIELIDHIIFPDDDMGKPCSLRHSMNWGVVLNAENK